MTQLKTLIVGFDQFVNEMYDTGESNLSKNDDMFNYTFMVDVMNSRDPNDEDDQEWLKGDEAIVAALKSTPENVIEIGSPTANEDLAENPEFQKIFGHLFDQEHLTNGYYVLRSDVKKESFHKTENAGPGGYADYVLVEVNDVPVVFVESDDGPYIYVTKAGLDQLKNNKSYSQVNEKSRKEVLTDANKKYPNLSKSGMKRVKRK